MARRRPYTEAGLRRVPCSIPGCTTKSRCQWFVRSCAAGGPYTWRAVCLDHDVELNRLLLEAFGASDINATLIEYRRSMAN